MTRSPKSWEAKGFWQEVSWEVRFESIKGFKQCAQQNRPSGTRSASRIIQMFEGQCLLMICSFKVFVLTKVLSGHRGQASEAGGGETGGDEPTAADGEGTASTGAERGEITGGAKGPTETSEDGISSISGGSGSDTNGGSGAGGGGTGRLCWGEAL